MPPSRKLAHNLSLCTGFQALREDVPKVMHLAVEMLTTPAVPEQKLALVKSQVGKQGPDASGGCTEAPPLAQSALVLPLCSRLFAWMWHAAFMSRHAWLIWQSLMRWGPLSLQAHAEAWG